MDSIAGAMAGENFHERPSGELARLASQARGVIGGFGKMKSPMVVRARAVAEARLRADPARLARARQMAATAIVLARRLDPLSGTCLLAAAWLHDVSDVDVFHAKRSPALDSAKIARASGFDNAVVSLVAYCSGAVYEARELGLLAELTTFRRPPPKLLDALTYCDLTTDRYGFRTTADAYLEEILQGRRPDDPTHRATLAARDELLAAVARVQSWM